MVGFALESVDPRIRRLLVPPAPHYLTDETQTRALIGRADAVALPSSPAEVAEVVAWCYRHEVPIVPRGGGTGYAGGCVPLDGGVVLSLERLTRVRAFDPLEWRIHVDAGVRTADLRRVVRESGLLFPPDPGAAEQSQVGGNIATNAGGPHAFKYGVTGHWVTGVEAVLAPGELAAFGGRVRKDVAGYDVRGLLVGSEGTLGVVTGAWLRLIPAPEVQLPAAALYADIAGGAAAVARVFACGVVPAALEFLDAGALAAAARSFPQPLPPEAGFMVIVEADGSAAEAAAGRRELVDALAEDALLVVAPDARADVDALWRWRDGVSFAVTAVRGGKVSEDIVVPMERLGDAVVEVAAIGERHGVETVSWGHAGDGNLHATFLVDLGDEQQLHDAEEAAKELFALALAYGGSVSGEHGIGVAKVGQVEQQWDAAAIGAARAVKNALDPKGLLNPGKKLLGSSGPT